MTRIQARQHVNELLQVKLQKAPKRVSGHDTYICPICGNGSGNDGTGICTKNGKNYTCFKGCFTSLDYIDILKLEHGFTRESEIFEYFGLVIDSDESVSVQSKLASPKVESKETPKIEPKESPIDYTNYLKLCHSRVKDTDYFSLRGIGEKVVNEFQLGFEPKYQSKIPRVIIPTSKSSSYVARDARTEQEQEQEKEPKILKSRGPVSLFNREALYHSKSPYVFVVEGEFDALSVLEVGGQAVALGSTAYKNKFVELVKSNRPAVPLVLSLDNEKTGMKCQAELKRDLEQLKIPFFEENISFGCKDPNEALIKDRERFEFAVNNFVFFL